MADKLSITWLGHASFKIDTPGKKTLYLDPWLGENPSCPQDQKKVEKCDLILITHGHFDHVGDVIPLAKAHKAPIVAQNEVAVWLGEKGVGRRQAA